VLREKKLYANMYKCELFQNNIHYLGHIISKEGIAVDPQKVEAIMNWHTPQNVMDVRYFMGLVGYYRIFIGEFSNIYHPITSL
jgi:hypothetical protein